MTKKERRKASLVFIAIAALFMIAAILIDDRTAGKNETIQEVMRDAVLHDMNKVSLFGIMDVNPGFIAAMIVSAILIVFALICRLYFIPRFTMVPGKMQIILETAVSLFDNMAKDNSKKILQKCFSWRPTRNRRNAALRRPWMPLRGTWQE